MMFYALNVKPKNAETVILARNVHNVNRNVKKRKRRNKRKSAKDVH